MDQLVNITVTCPDCSRTIDVPSDAQVGDVLVCMGTDADDSLGIEADEGCGVELEIVKMDTTDPEKPIVEVDYLVVEK